MAVTLNHHIVHARDPEASAQFLTEILGLPAPTHFGPFVVVNTANGASLDFMGTDDEKYLVPNHYAFLVSEDEFDEIFGRIQERGLDVLRRPGRPGAGGDLPPLRRPGRLLGRPRRPLARDPHRPLRRLARSMSWLRWGGRRRRRPDRRPASSSSDPREAEEAPQAGDRPPPPPAARRAAGARTPSGTSCLGQWERWDEATEDWVPVGDPGAADVALLPAQDRDVRVAGHRRGRLHAQPGGVEPQGGERGDVGPPDHGGMIAGS